MSHSLSRLLLLYPFKQRNPRRSRRRRLMLEVLEPRYVPTGYQVSGFDLGFYTDVGEDPTRGDGQITAAELQQRIDAAAPYMKWGRTYVLNQDTLAAGQLLHARGKKAAIGAWIGPDQAANLAQIDALVDQAIQGHVDVAIVGSEVLLRGDVSEAVLLGYINSVKSRLAQAGLSSIPVTTAETYGVLLQHPQVIQAVDVVYANFFPFWEGVAVRSAVAKLAADYQQLKAAAGGKPVVVSETGWPTDGSAVGAAVPSGPSAAFYFLSFVSWARANSVDYFYFSAQNEPWKRLHNDYGSWGVFDGHGQPKHGMDRVFNDETVPSTVYGASGPGPLGIDFFALPDKTPTNLATFVVGGTTAPGNVVRVNGTPAPPEQTDVQGAYYQTIPLAPGPNMVTVAVETAAGDPVVSATKVVVYDPALDTGGRKLLYVDVSAGPALDGTAVIDPEQFSVLGLIPGAHVRGISPAGSEIYVHDNRVFSTASHQLIRTLPFSQPISSSGFLVSPVGDRLYSRTEVVDVATNTIVAYLPVDITLPPGFGGATAAGGPALSPDGSTIYCYPQRGTGAPIKRIDTATLAVSDTGIVPGNVYVGDIKLTHDGQRLMVSQYAGLGIVHTFDVSTYQSIFDQYCGDFMGELGLLANDWVVVGAAGNPANGGGAIITFNPALSVMGAVRPIPLADNLATSRLTNEVFVSSGSVLGVQALDWTGGALMPQANYVFGVHRFVISGGTPHNDQIGRLVFKPSANHAPVLDPIGNLRVNLGQSLAVTCPVYEYDAPFDGVTFTLVGAPPGAGIDSATGVLSWTPAAGQTPGAYTFNVRATDTGSPALFDEVTATIVVNAPPANVVPGSQATNEDTPRVFSAANGNPIAVADPGGSALDVTLTSTHGPLTLAGLAGLTVAGNGTGSVRASGSIADLNAAFNGLIFTPNPDFNGSATITVATSDGALSDTDVVTVTVAAVNDAPVLSVPGMQTTNEDVGLVVTGIAVADVDSGTGDLRVTLTVTPGTGTLFVVDDSGLTTVAGNHTPVVTVTGSLAHVNSVIAAVGYVPTPEFNGPGVLTLGVNDLGNTGAGGALTDTRTVGVTVAAVNDAPRFTVPPALTILEDAGPQSITGFATGMSAGPPDEAGQSLAFTTVVTATGGTLAFLAGPTVDASGALVFTVAPDTNGTATIAITLTDSGSGAAPNINATTKTVTLSVTAVNDVPIVTLMAGDPPAVDEDAGSQSVPGFVIFQPGPASATDELGQTWSYEVTVVGMSGTLAFAKPPAIAMAGNLSYSVAPNAYGTATVRVVAHDSGGTANGGADTSAPHFFTITINPVNDPPAAVGDAATVTEDAAVAAVDVLANDSTAPDTGETLSIVAVTQPAHGVVSITNGGTGLTYRPAPDFNGTDSFTYMVGDGHGGTATAAVTVTVTPVNDPPTTADDTLTIDEDAAATPVSVLVNDTTQPDMGETLSVVTVTQPAHGSIVVTGGGTGLTYRPAANFFGTDAFTYTVADGRGGTDSATVTVTVRPVNDPPTAVADAATLAEDVGPIAIDVLANDSTGPDTGETLTVAAVTQPAHGIVAITGGGASVTYHPAPDFHGADAFTYTVGDGQGGIATAAVTVTVIPGNDPPTATDDTFTVSPGQATVLSVLVNDSTGPDTGETLTVAAVTQPLAGGAVALTPGGVAFTPTTGFTGEATFTYTISDGHGGTASASVAVTVMPTAIPFLVGGPANGSVRLLAAAGDELALGDSFAALPGLGVNARTAVADVTGDSIPDYVIGAGPGSLPRVTLIDGKTSVALVTFSSFEETFAGGVFVAAADVDGDGKAEVVVTPDESGGPIVAVYRGAQLAAGVGGQAAQLARFFGIAGDPNFRGGCRPALGDLNGDGAADLVVSAGVQGGPRIAVFDGRSLAAGSSDPGRLVGDFFAFEDTLRNGAFVAAGDVTGDGHADLAFGGGPGGAPRVRLFDGARLLATPPVGSVDGIAGVAQRANFFAGDSSLRGGVRLALHDIDGNGASDLVAGSGAGEPSRVRVYTAANLLAGAAVPDADVDPFGAVLANGVFVG